MNKYTEDQSSPAKSSPEETIQHSAHSPSTNSELKKKATGSLKVDETESKVESPAPVKKFWKKPSDMPKRPMSSYNIFYRMERERLVEGERPRLYSMEDVNQFVAQQKIKDSSPKPKRKHRRTHGKISFTDLARVIASNWKNMDDDSKVPFRERAVIEKKAYTAEIAAWNKSKNPSATGGTKRKADHSIVPKQEKSQLSEPSNIDGNDSDYELYSDADTYTSHEAATGDIRPTGTEKDTFLDDVHRINPTNTRPHDVALPQSRRQEQHEEQDRIYSGLTFDSSHHQDDFFSTGGTLNRSRSLSDITDYEDLTLPNRRITGHHNASFQGQAGRFPIEEPQRLSPSTRIGFNSRQRHEIHTAHFDGARTLAPNFSEHIPEQLQVDRTSNDIILNRYTSQYVRSLLNGVDQFPQNISGQITGTAANAGQNYIRHRDDPTQRNMIESNSTIPFQLQSNSLSRLHQTARLSYSTQANSSAFPLSSGQSMATARNNYLSQQHHSGQAVSDERTEIPQYLYNRQHIYQERPADFVTSSEDVEIGYALLSSQIQSRGQLHPPGLLLSPQLSQQPSDGHTFNIPSGSYPVNQPIGISESSRQYEQQSIGSNAVNQTNFFHQSNEDRIFNAQEATYQTTQPYRTIAPSLPYSQHLIDNNVINQSGAMYHMAQQIVQSVQNDNSTYASNENETSALQQPFGIAEAQPQQQQHQREGYHSNQSSDESQFWDF